MRCILEKRKVRTLNVLGLLLLTVSLRELFPQKVGFLRVTCTVSSPRMSSAAHTVSKGHPTTTPEFPTSVDPKV